MDISEVFIKWIIFLITGATTTVNLNGNPEENFKVDIGVRQGCPLASYIFLIVGKTLIYIIKKMVKESRLKIIILPRGINQQNIS